MDTSIMCATEMDTILITKLLINNEQPQSPCHQPWLALGICMDFLDIDRFPFQHMNNDFNFSQ